MKKMINRIFSDKYVNHKAVVGNALLLLMYRFAYPFAVLLNKLHLSPNQITTQSLVFSILAFVALVYDEGWVWFSILWGMTVLLDFCDGTVARMTDSVSKQAFRYDHMSDLFKIFLLFLGTGIRYESNLVWIVSSSVLFIFMYYTLLNHEISHVKRLLEKNGEVSKNNSDAAMSSVGKVAGQKRIRDRYRIVAWVAKHDLLFDVVKKISVPLATINGHTLLLFFLLPLGPEMSVGVFIYFGLMALVTIRAHIAGLIALPKP